jgi:ArsR family transcriptional regulator, arsenate/arsenite/antimonite-responsive transcriptional repressor
MKAEARLFKSLADETRLRILCLLTAKKELCVCDIMRVLGITQSKASRHLRYLYNLGLVTDRREGLWMYYSLCVAPGSHGDKLLKVLHEMLEPLPEAKALRQRLTQWLKHKKSLKAKAVLSGEVGCACTNTGQGDVSLLPRQQA